MQKLRLAREILNKSEVMSTEECIQFSPDGTIFYIFDPKTKTITPELTPDHREMMMAWTLDQSRHMAHLSTIRK